VFLRFCPCNWGTRKREAAAPEASVCFLGGTQEILDCVSEDFLGGTGKAEDVKLTGAGIIPKLCPMERLETETMVNNKFSESSIASEDGRQCDGDVIRAEEKESYSPASVTEQGPVLVRTQAGRRPYRP